MLAHPRLGEWLGGVILFEETLLQSNGDGVPFAKVLKDKGVLTGVKTDKGLAPIPGSSRETTTRGMDTLLERSKGYYARGARFAKWCVNVLPHPAFTRFCTPKGAAQAAGGGRQSCAGGTAHFTERRGLVNVLLGLRADSRLVCRSFPRHDNRIPGAW